ncbi:unnamed protein product [Protopolystoma xenopodis]|uniref:Uncharacterized protein n=1 Tax=Protopolystoma xenopodis TaxID=117903 RepID=A0A448XI83_9PLAT|nr:unnamed protein product [Protopolystoma xenopodis]
MASQILRFFVFSPYPANLSVDFQSISCSARAMSLMFLDWCADISSCFTDILPLTVAAFDEINSREIKIVCLRVLRRQTGEQCLLLLCYHPVIPFP